MYKGVIAEIKSSPRSKYKTLLSYIILLQSENKMLELLLSRMVLGYSKMQHNEPEES